MAGMAKVYDSAKIAPQEAKLSQVQEVLTTLQKALTDLQAATSILETRLATVLRIAEPRVSNDIKDNPGNVALAAELTERLTEVFNITAILSYMTDRLEL